MCFYFLVVTASMVTALHRISSRFKGRDNEATCADANPGDCRLGAIGDAMKLCLKIKRNKSDSFKKRQG